MIMMPMYCIHTRHAVSCLSIVTHDKFTLHKLPSSRDDNHGFLGVVEHAKLHRIHICSCLSLTSLVVQPLIKTPLSDHLIMRMRTCSVEECGECHK